MYLKKGGILAICLLMLAQAGWSQKAKRTRKSHAPEHYDKSITRMSKGRTKILCPLFGNGKSLHALGVKMGDPFAITYKYYLGERLGIVVDLGKASSGLYNRYYREAFPDFLVTDTLQDEAQLTYLTHRVKSDWIAELKFLWHIDVKKITPGLKVYLGVGPEIKGTQLEYQYLYENNGNGSGNPVGRFTRRRVTFGPQATAGIEYAHSQVPLSAFMELEFFNDVFADPGWRRFEGGVGLRYIFKHR